ncbi:MAG: mandelate racemase/muconate lactonizing enzyme family protein [Acidobacteriia bacterium]|nr:mandelate racemase/muconate lactonizing enzyme family protein [Terriglobia bacterium]
MKIDRRKLLAMLPAALGGAGPERRVVPDYEKPLFELHKVSSSPVKIARIELLRVGSNHFVRTTSTGGAVGICRTKQVEDYIAILLRRVAPHFIGKDARDLESLIDSVYIQNYKLAGQAFWAPVAFVEQSLFDLLGKVANKPVGALLGGVIRKEIPVYLSGSGRETTAEEEVDVYVRGVEMTQAKAVKFKIGGRMSRNLDAYPGRTETMMKLARKRLGDKMILYTDANGSYDAAKGIEVGRMLESLGCGFYEEPCPWEELGETKKVADALSMPVACGEQDASLWRFQWMMENRVMDIVQPDLNYNGGFIRACRVARMARAHKMNIVPHNTQTDASAANIVQFASAVPNIGPFMELPFRAKEKKESWFTPNFVIRNGVVKVPEGAGLGVEIDPDYLKGAVVEKA